MTDCAIGPRFPDRPKTLAEQLETAVRANQCEARIVTNSIAHGPGRVLERRAGDRCDSLHTTLHAGLGRRLCWLHSAAADNFERSTGLQFVENK